MGSYLSCASGQAISEKHQKSLCDPYTIKDYIIDDNCLNNSKYQSRTQDTMPFSAYSEKKNKIKNGGHLNGGSGTSKPSNLAVEKFPQPRSSPVMISRRMKGCQSRRSASAGGEHHSSSYSPTRVQLESCNTPGCHMNGHYYIRQNPNDCYSAHPYHIYQNGNHDLKNGKLNGNGRINGVGDGDYVKVQKRPKNVFNNHLQTNVTSTQPPPSPIHSVGNRSSISSQKFATVSQRFSFSYDPESMPRLVLQSTPHPPDVSIPLAQPIPTPPPTPPVRMESRSNGMIFPKPRSENPNPKGSLTSIVNFLKRQSYAETESLFKVTLRKSRSRSKRRSDEPKIRYLPAISQSPHTIIEEPDRPNVVYRPRYYQHRRSLVEGLEKLHILADDPTDGLDLGIVDPKKIDGRRDSCPEALSSFNPEEFNRSYSFHHSKRPSEVRALQTLRKCKTVSRPRDGPAPKSPQTLQRKNPRKHAFYFFHIRSSNVHQTECFLFGDIVTELAQRFCCELRMMPVSETPDLPDGLRRVEVAGPTLRDIKKFLYFLTTSEETVTLQRQIQERHTLARKLSRATDKSDSVSPCSREVSFISGVSATSPCPSGVCSTSFPKGYV